MRLHGFNFLYCVSDILERLTLLSGTSVTSSDFTGE